MQVRNCTNCSVGAEPVEGVAFPSELYQQMDGAPVSRLLLLLLQLQFQLQLHLHLLLHQLSSSSTCCFSSCNLCCCSSSSS